MSEGKSKVRGWLHSIHFMFGKIKPECASNPSPSSVSRSSILQMNPVSCPLGIGPHTVVQRKSRGGLDIQ